MSETLWLPGLLVLGVGLAAGLAAAFLLRRGPRSPEPKVELRVRDLERRRVRGLTW